MPHKPDVQFKRGHWPKVERRTEAARSANAVTAKTLKILKNNMTLKIIQDSVISKKEFLDLARERFGDMVKAVVDIEREIMAIGGDLHADEEALLLEQESKQEDLWGINLYPEKTGDDRIEFDSMINIRPSQGNRSRGVENPAIREKIREIVKKIIIA